MPAGSESPGAVALPHTWRPFGVRLAGAVLGGGLVVVCALAWIGFDEETQAKFTAFERGTLAFFGLLAFALWFALVRSRVVAEQQRLVVVNGYRRREFEWPQVVAVRLPPGAPWVTLDLADGTTVAAMGIQGSDGDRARSAVRELRAVVERQTGAR
ncbi:MULTISPECIES: PH domain-containing protein [unclassified Nocardioides]|uniref:PH domain-containing protein n=1 Tax=Nocardioides sp. URHA0032 TaxID=1380388 RepID=UPI00048C4770|nr:PH domain-containing protein [Nocardioides sp. URHA0032]